MRVDIHQELDPGDPQLELPWEDESGSGLRYVDIKAHPELALHLAECQNRPALAKLLEAINSPICRTAKCDVWETNDLAEDERRDFGLACKVGSYVDVILDEPKFNARVEPQLLLAGLIAKGAENLRVQAQLEICVRRCLFHPERRGHYLTLFIHAYGETADEAEKEWDRVCAWMAEAWGGIDREFRSSGVKFEP
jgi:hypothetical protein